MDIFNTNDTFDFEKLVMTKPTAISGGNYFIHCLVNNQPLYIQPPKCKTRQGIVKAGVGKRFYSDLMFTNENEDFIRWMENLENYCQQYIYKNREKWFDGEMELHDIENYFTSPLKLFKSGKYYIVRTNVSTVLGKTVLKIYDENENEIDNEAINENTNVMTILEIQGVKCSSKSFQIEIELKQMMVLQPTNIFEKCIIKNNTSAPISTIDSPVNGLIEVSPDSKERSSEELEPKATILSPLPSSEQSGFDIKIGGENPGSSLDNATIALSVNDEEITFEKERVEITNKDSTELLQESISNNDGLEEVEFHLEELNVNDPPILIKKRDNIYYEMYKEASKKAKVARDLALSAYLEAKRIKNTYMLEDIDSEDEIDSDEEYIDSDEENDEIENNEENDEQNI